MGGEAQRRSRGGRTAVLVRWLAAGAVIGAGAGWLADPVRHLSSQRLRILVSDRCGHSVSILSALENDAALQDAVVPLPVQADGGTSEAACAIATRELRADAPWFAVLPSGWICDRFVAHARRLRREGSGILPAWFRGETELRGVERDAALDARGLRLKASTRGLALVRSTEPVVDEGRAAPAGPVEWRGFPIGW